MNLLFSELIFPDSNSFLFNDFCIVALLSLGVAGVDFYFNRKTAMSVVRLDHNTHYGMLLDIVRHLYRNKVVIEAIKHKLEAIRYKGYPSEEHLLKQEMITEDLRLELSNSDESAYSNMHELTVLFRNYNIEIENTLNHLKDQDMDLDTKKHDLDTLAFKPGYLTSRVLKVICKMDFDGLRHKLSYRLANAETRKAKDKEINEYYRCMVREAILAEHQNKNDDTVPKDKLPLPEGEKKDKYLTDIFHKDKNRDEQAEYLENLSTDITIEVGLNQKDQKKIHIIKFKK